MTRLLYMLLALPAFSVGPPAGAAVALAYTRLDTGHWQVWLANPDGTNARRFTESPWDKRSLRAVPGEAQILLRDNQGQIYRLDATPPAREAKVDLGFDVVKDFDFRPRAGWLIAAYAPNALDNVCIWQVSADGGQKRLLIPDPYLNETPRWLEGAESILFAKGHAGKSWLCVSRTAHPKAEILVGEGFRTVSDPEISPDGTRVVFCGKKEKTVDLWVTSLKEPAAKRLHQGSSLEAEPSWSPDGAWIYFSSWNGINFRLARIRPNGADFGYLSPEGMDCRCPVVLLISSGGKDE